MLCGSLAAILLGGLAGALAAEESSSSTAASPATWSATLGSAGSGSDDDQSSCDSVDVDVDDFTHGPFYAQLFVGGQVAMVFPVCCILLGALVQKFLTKFLPSMPYTPALLIVGILTKVLEEYLSTYRHLACTRRQAVSVRTAVQASVVALTRVERKYENVKSRKDDYAF